MSLSKLLNDMSQKTKGTSLSEFTDCIITLITSRKNVERYIADNGREPLIEELNEALNDLTVVASSAILGPERPTEEEMHNLLTT